MKYEQENNRTYAVIENEYETQDCEYEQKMLQKNTKTQDFQEIGEDIFVKDTFLAVFVQKSGRTVTFLYEIGYFMGIYENN